MEVISQMKIKKIELKSHGDKRGQLVSIEQFKDIPFSIKRVYYIYDTKDGETRGHHAHKSLEQFLVCVKGSCKVKIDDGNIQEEFNLSRPTEGLYISDLIWREMSDFTSDCVLMVLASNVYDESDYIRKYSSFLEYVNKNQRSNKINQKGAI